MESNHGDQVPTTHPAGWYPSPNKPGYGEYWDGARWAGTVRTNTTTQLDSAPAAVSSTKALSPMTWVILIVVGLVSIITLATSGISGLLIVAGSVALVTALYVLVTGRRSWARVPSKKAGGLLLAGALVACFTGGGIAPHPDQAATIVQFADDSAPTSSSSSSSSASHSTAPTVKKPVVTTEDVAVTESVPFDSTTVDDPNLTAGTSQVSVAGVPGTRTITYRVTMTDGKETSRVQVSDVVTVAPVAQVTSNGTYVAPQPIAEVPSSDCDGNYSGACVPVASDVDCAGGSGNGPAYVSGPVYVVGSDIYDLDRDGDGVACD